MVFEGDVDVVVAGLTAIPVGDRFGQFAVRGVGGRGGRGKAGAFGLVLDDVCFLALDVDVAGRVNGEVAGPSALAEVSNSVIGGAGGARIFTLCSVQSAM